MAKDMFPISNWRGYIRVPWASREQACSAALQAVKKDWQSLPSSSMASLSRPCILSLCDCCRVQARSAQAASASLIVAVQVASASQITVMQWASASQVMVAQWAFAFLMVLVVWASF